MRQRKAIPVKFICSSLDFLSGDQEMISTVKLMEKATGGLMLVHVDDLCRAEIFLAEKPPPPPAAAAERYICCGLSATMLQLARFLAAKYPEYNVDVAA
jgi:anthocyanidin reductase